MRYITMDKIQTGTHLARPLYNNSGAILIKQGAAISPTLLKKLSDMNYVGLYVDDELSRDIIIEDIIEEDLRLQASELLKEILDKKQDYGKLYPVIAQIIDQVLSNRQRLIQVNYLQNYNEYLYAHSVNVCILSIRMGLEFDLNFEKLSNLAMAGILHDIGKTKVPSEIVNKLEELTPEESVEFKKHPVYGYEMTKEAPSISSTSRLGILDHHERKDGSGYPRGLKGDEISIWGKILGVTDTYDTMTTDPIYHNAYSVADVVEYFMANANSLYDFDVIQAFTRCIAVYPTGSIVKLSNGQEAIVVKNYIDCILRPYIRLADTMEEIDLKDDPRYLGLSILKVIS